MMKKSYTIYIDDLRTPVEEFDCIARSYEEAIEIFKKYGMPSFISFDHDLGLHDGKVAKSGLDVAKWIVQHDLNEEYKIPPDFAFEVHSQNPVGKQNIESLLSSYLEYKKNSLEGGLP